MQRIKPLSLPKKLPDKKAIKPNINYNGYEPENWGIQYEFNPYLKDLSKEDLIDRYKSIINNMEILLSAKRDIIPIESSLSSWYWFRKEHQTRLELTDRKVNPKPFLYGKKFYSKPDPPISITYPNSTSLLFKYGKRKHLEPMLKKGVIRINPSSTYSNQKLEAARRDNEQNKSSFIPNHQVHLKTKDGQPIQGYGYMRRSISAKSYYIFCVSCNWHPSLFDAFGEDSCLVIKQPEEFSRRLKNCCKQLKGWYFLDCPVQYFDPYERPPKMFFSTTMSKIFKYAYQQEFRFLWDGLEQKIAKKEIDIEIGSIKDIAEIYDKPAT